MNPAPGAAGAIYSTVDDLFIWDRGLCSDRLLKKNLRELMFKPNTSVPESQAAGGRQHSNYGYGWRIYNVVHPTTQKKTRVINHGGAINGFRAFVNRIPSRNAFIAILCNQGDPPGSNTVWLTLNRMNTEFIHVVTEQPHKVPRLRHALRTSGSINSFAVRELMPQFRGSKKKVKKSMGWITGNCCKRVDPFWKI